MPTLTDATKIERQGKIPYYLNRQMRHFTFKASYARMIETIKDNASAGKFIKAVCGYMFDGIEPSYLPEPIDIYFKLFRKSFDLSRHRSESGRKGGLKGKKRLISPSNYASKRKNICCKNGCQTVAETVNFEAG